MLTVITTDLVESNNADWSSSLTLPALGSVPWSGALAYDTAADYALGAVVRVGADLYQATGNPVPGNFDPSQWFKIAAGAAYASDPYDPTGAELRMFVSRPDAEGVADPSQIVARLSKSEGTLILTARVITINYKAVKARELSPGTYKYDLLGIKTLVTGDTGAGSTPITTVETRRLFAGSFVIEQGITR